MPFHRAAQTGTGGEASLENSVDRAHRSLWLLTSSSSLRPAATPASDPLLHTLLYRGVLDVAGTAMGGRDKVSHMAGG